MTPSPTLSQAILLHQDGKLAEAASLYQQVLTCEERNFHAWYLFALLLYQQQRTAEASAAVDVALTISPGVAEALALKGVVQQQAGQPAKAATNLENAVTVRPGYTEAWYNLGVARASMGLLAEAVAAFDKALALEPKAEIWNERGLALRLLKRNAEALASFDCALALKPGLVSVLNNRGILLTEEKRFAEALATYREVLAIEPNYAAAHYNIGVLLHNERDRLDEALACFDKALALQPDSAKSWAGRAAALQAMQRFIEALASADRALDVDPDYAPGYSGRGSILYEMNRVPEGMIDFARHAQMTHAKMEAEVWRPPHKQRHDQEQREHLAAKGIVLKPGALHLGDGARLATPAINPANSAEATRVWETSRPQIVVIDNLLTEAALTRLRRYCQDSTMWQEIYPAGYLGAMPESGFACPLLAQIADELRDIFPAIFGAHPLRYSWAYKYDSILNGTEVHADFAAVNVNFWITPDEANLNPESGGLEIWDVSAPLEWEFTKYNGDTKVAYNFLARAKAKSVTVPYRANRAVVFDSALFHKTDTIDFKPGYDNRRINVTMLYGRRRFDGG